MAIRSATPDDLAPMADLAQDQRVRLQGWDPSYWNVAPRAREIHPLLLRWSVESGRSVSLVATSGAGLAGYAVAVPLIEPSGSATGSVTGSDAGSTWLVDDIGLAAGERWSHLGAVLLAAVAGRTRTHGGTRLVVACPSSDRARRAALAAAGLDLGCWFRHVRLDRVLDSVEPPEHDDGPGFPLPHVHALSGAVTAATSVTAPGAHALVTHGLVTPPVFRTDGTTTLADPVIADGAPNLWRGARAVENAARRHGDVAVLAAVGPGEEPLDEVLEQRGYGRPVEWWVLRRRR